MMQFYFVVNKIPSFVGLDSEKLGQLHTLELRGNRLKSLSGINLPNLKNLYLVCELFLVTLVQR